MTASRRFIPALVFAFALPAGPIPGAAVAGAVVADAPVARAERPFIRKVHVRVWETGAVAPNVSVSVPTWLVTVLVRTASVTGLFDCALDRATAAGGDSPAGLRLRGRQIDALWSSLVGSGPASLVEVDDGHGVRVEVRVD